MTEANDDSLQSQLDEIKSLLKEGQKIAAIRLLREGTGRGLKESKEMIEQIEAQMVADGELEKTSATGCSGMILLGATTLGGAAWLFS
ncbi:MAG: ribosomal protein L7/L12 [Blastopirellula sp. JB062]